MFATARASGPQARTRPSRHAAARCAPGQQPTLLCAGQAWHLPSMQVAALRGAHASRPPHCGAPNTMAQTARAPPARSAEPGLAPAAPLFCLHAQCAIDSPPHPPQLPPQPHAARTAAFPPCPYPVLLSSKTKHTALTPLTRRALLLHTLAPAAATPALVTNDTATTDAERGRLLTQRTAATCARAPQDACAGAVGAAGPYAAAPPPPALRARACHALLLDTPRHVVLTLAPCLTKRLCLGPRKQH